MSARRGYVIVAHRTPGASPAVTLAGAWGHLYRSQPAANAGLARFEREKDAGGWTGVERFEVCEVRS